jgi:mannosyltransferase OCH1-like enzyme/glycosyltransferase involved in cell wall biosynthesis
MNKIKLYHQNWNDFITITKNRIKRESENNDEGECKFIDNFMSIKWDKWGMELFYQTTTNNYYFIENNNLLNKTNDIFSNNIFYVFNIDLIINNEIVYCLVDKTLNKVYNRIMLNLIGILVIIDNNIILINDEEYIYINFKYYNKNDILKEYNIISIENQLYFLKDGIFIKNYDSINNNFINNNYIIYNNILKINDKYFKTIDNYNYTSIEKEYLINININNINNNFNYYTNNINNNFNYYTNNINNNFNYYTNNIYLKNNKLLDKNIIEYYKNFDINIIIIDDIKNKDDNIIFYDINFIYNYDNNLKDIIIEDIDYTNNTDNLIDILNEKYINKDLLYNKWNLINKNNKLIEQYNTLNMNEINEIPKILHFIWIGNNNIPSIYIKYIETWIKYHPEYSYCLWNDYNIPKLINQKLYDSSTIYALKADILRYELLYFFGGVYIDCDFLCLKNIDDLLKDIDGFSGWESDKYIAIGIMGFKKYDDFLYKIIINLQNNILNKNNKTIPEKSGPIYFTNQWNKYINNQSDKYINNQSDKYINNQSDKYINNQSRYISYEQDYFYSYTFDDKYNNKNYINQINNEKSYAIHMWGYSWKKSNPIVDIYTNYLKYINYQLYIIDIIDFYNSNNNISKNRLDIISFQQEFLYKKSNMISFKPKIVHIMGMFFTGGIERYLYYIDKYGNHEKYDYYILYINDTKHYYHIKNIKMISYDWDHILLNQYLQLISPALIIDHYSIYLDDNNIIYNKINRNNIIYFIHSAICYNRNIELLNIKNAIHLYKEINKELSWNKIKNNYYISLGVELNNLNFYDSNIVIGNIIDGNIVNGNIIDSNIVNGNIVNGNIIDSNIVNGNIIDSNIVNGNIKNNQFKNKLNINIIGRITEEKIPIIFLEKLCKLSIKIYKNIIFNIYGEKDIKFNKEYVDKFNGLIKNSKIKVHNFIDPENIYKIYENTDILLISSSYETGSFTCLEAFSYGIPVIARNVYGLKYLIKDSISGYLFNNDEEILNKISNISENKYDKLLDIDSKNNIIEISKNYNIIDKIKDFENIIDENLKSKNLVILTSVLNCSDNPLSYYNIRSIFDVNERYKQTLKSISTIKQKIPDCEILLCECSDLDEFQDLEIELKEKVDYYYNFYKIVSVREKVISKYKGLGEANLLLESINIVENELYKKYTNIFKLSGRYYLNNNFNYDIFNNDFNQFTYWDNSTTSYCTLVYKIKYNFLIELKNSLYKSLDDLNKGESIEQCLFKYFNNNNNNNNNNSKIQIINKFNVSGFLATEGYLFSV